MHTLQAAGVLAVAVLSPKEELLDPHLKARRFFDIVETPNGKRPVPHQIGAKFSAFEPDSGRVAPSLGQHNSEVLSGILGMSEAEIADLKERGVIGDEPISAVPLPVMRMFVQIPLASYTNMGALGGLDTDYREQLGLKGAGS
jgi:hypothetical protein